MNIIIIQMMTPLQMENRGIEGTDTACLVEVDGVAIGYGDDYETPHLFVKNDGRLQDALACLVSAASDVWSETSTG